MAVTSRPRFATLAETTTTSDPGISGTGLAVTDRTKFPQADQFAVVVQASETDKTNREIMLVTGGQGSSGGTFTVLRGQSTTSAVSHTTGSYVAQVFTEEALRAWAPEYVFHPRHNGLLLCPYDPSFVAGSHVPAFLTPTLVKCWVPETVTLTNLCVFTRQAGTALSATSCQCGVYLSNGTRIATTVKATTATAFNTVGMNQLALTVDAGRSLTVTGGADTFIWLALTASGSTNPTFFRRTSLPGIQASCGLAAASARWGTLATIATGADLPTSFTPSSITLLDSDLWLGAN